MTVAVNDKTAQTTITTMPAIILSLKKMLAILFTRHYGVILNQSKNKKKKERKRYF